MMRRLLEFLAIAVVLASSATPALAQPFGTTIVKSDGDDLSDCGVFAARCETIQKGILNVASGGTVLSLDANASGAVLIDKPFTLVNEGGEAQSALPSIGGAGIFISLPSGSDILTLRGIGVDQRNTANHGITFEAAGTLHLQNCFLRGSGDGFGINFVPTGTSELYISNCVIADNAPSGATGGGILIKPSGAASVKVVLENVSLENNLVGILIDSRFTTGSNAVTIRNSTIFGNSSFGLATYESGSGTSTVTIEGSNISNNTASFGVGMSGAGATARLLNSTVTGNARGLLAASSSSIISHGGNVIAGNTINGAFTSTVPPQ